MCKVDFCLFLLVTSCIPDAKAQYDIPPPEEYPEPPSLLNSMSISARAALNQRPFPTYPAPQTVESTTELPKPTPNLKTEVSLGELGHGDSDSDHHHHHDHNPMPYSFKYAVNDPITGNVHSRNEVGDDTGLVTGSYQLIQPDGSLRIVEYTADWVNGFRANVRIIPNYAPPPPPPSTAPWLNVPNLGTLSTLITPQHTATASPSISTSTQSSAQTTPTLVTEESLSPPTPSVSTSRPPPDSTTKNPLSVPFRVGPHTVVCITCN